MGEIWERYRERSLVDSAPDPELIPSLFTPAQTQRDKKFQQAPDTSAIRPPFSPRNADAWVEAAERAYYRSRGSMAPADLTLFDAQDLELLDPETAQAMSDVSHYESAQQKVWQDMNDEADRLARKKEKTDEIRRKTAQAWIPFLSLGGAAGLIDLEVTPDERRAAEYEKLVKEYRDEIKDMTKADTGPGWWDRFKSNLSTALKTSPMTGGFFLGAKAFGYVATREVDLSGLEEAGQVNTGTASGLGLVTNIMSATRQHKQDAAAEEKKAAVEKREQAAARQSAVTAQAVWEQADPATQQVFLDAAGGDPIMASSIFAAGWLFGNDEAREFVQLQQKSLDDQFDTMVSQLEEEQFSMGASTLDVLDSWGRLTANFGIGTSLLILDEDVRDDTVQEGLSGLLSNIAEYDAKPSAVWGIDGTFGGLAVDMGVMTIFDPTTWLFAPSATRGLATMSSAKQIEHLVTTSAGKRLFTETFELVGRGGRSEVSALSEMPFVYSSRFKAAVQAGDEVAAQAAFKDAMLAGWSPGRLDNLAWADYTGQGIRRALGDRSNDLIGTAERFWTPQLTQTQLPIHGATWVDDSLETAANIAGGNKELFDEFNTKLRVLLEADEAPKAARVSELRSQIEDLSDEVSILEQLSQGRVRPLGEGMALGGQSFDDLDGAIGFLESQAADPAAGRKLDQLKALRAQMTGRSPEELQAMQEVAGTSADDFVRQYGTAPEMFRSAPLPDPGTPDGVHWIHEGNQASGKLVRNEQLVGTIVVDYDDAGNALEISVNTTKQAKGDGSRLWQAAMEYDRQITPAWLAQNARNWSLTEDGARFVHGIVTNGLSEEVASKTSRQLLATKIPKMKQALAEFQSLSGVTPRDQVAQLWTDWFDKVIRSNENLRKIPGLIDEGSGKINYQLLRSKGDLPAKRRTGIPQSERGPWRALPEELKEYEDTIHRALWPLQDKTFVDLPVSPLDLVMAESIMVRASKGQLSSSNAAAAYFSKHWNSWMHKKSVVATREFIEFANLVWMYDKVMRPATAIVTSTDEMMRIFHSYGARGVHTYAVDKAAGVASRMNRAANKLAGRDLGPIGRAAQDRLARAIEAVPREVKGIERSLYERTGNGLIDITPSSHEFLDAARQHSNWFLQSDGFRAWRQGRFADWWETDAAQYLKNQKVKQPDGAESFLTMGEAEEMFKTLFNKTIVEQASPGARGEVIKAWDAAVARVEAGERAVELPDNILRQLKKIPAYAKDPNGYHPIQGVTGALDQMFLGTTNYRQQMISRLARDQKIKQLERLFESQRISIVEYDDLEKIALAKGFSLGPRHSLGVAGALDEVALKEGYVTRSYIEGLADRHARREMDRLMYSWHLTSPAGKASKAVVPFGKPYADMWGFWMKEVFSKPILRGWMHPENMGRLGKWTDNFLDHYPVGILPNRGSAMLSRVANLDMNLENQEINIRLPWSMLGPAGTVGQRVLGDEINVSGVVQKGLFLPTRGENPFLTMLPGIGVIPLSLADWLVPDPNSDPESWSSFDRFMNDTFPQLVPTANYGHPTVTGRYLGGGWASFALRSFGAQSMITSHVYPYAVTEATADMGAAVQSVRQLKVSLADPEVWNELLGYGTLENDEDLMNQLLTSYVYTALEDAGTGFQQELLTRQLVPLALETDSTFEDVEEIWLQAYKQFPDLVDPRDVQAFKEDPNSPAARAAAAGSVREAFYNMPQEEQDMLILKYPALQAQLVGSWTWNAQKVDEIPGTEGLYPFRHFPGDKGTETFQEYKRRSWIIPRPVKDVFVTTIGSYFNTRDRATKNIYSRAVRWINENDPDMVARNEGDPLNEEWRSNNTVEGSGGFSKSFLRYTFSVPVEDISPEAALLGISLGKTYTGEQLVDAIQMRLAEARENPLHALTVPKYQLDAEYRGGGRDKILAEIAQIAPGAKEYPDLWVKAVRNTMDEMRLNPPSEPHVAEMIGQVREGYAWLATSYKGFPWKTIWEDHFARDLGPWPEDYKPAEPPAGNPKDNEGFQPYIWDVTDGDSFEVSTNSQQGLRISAAFLPQLGFELGDQAPDRPKTFAVRLLGMRARDYSNDPEGAREDHELLFRQLQEAPPGSVWLVPDPRSPEVDQYGRRLVWLWVNGQYIYDPAALLPTDDLAYAQ